MLLLRQLNVATSSWTAHALLPLFSCLIAFLTVHNSSKFRFNSNLKGGSEEVAGFITGLLQGDREAKQKMGEKRRNWRQDRELKKQNRPSWQSVICQGFLSCGTCIAEGWTRWHLGVPSNSTILRLLRGSKVCVRVMSLWVPDESRVAPGATGAAVI